ncbi:MAG: tyrosine-type recombinase/integrase [Bacteriovoracia bacterium]
MSIAFEKSISTFLGYLEARGKSLNTVKNYRYDLDALHAFCEKYDKDFTSLSLIDLEAFSNTLRSQGLSTNSIRRRLITTRTFLRYLSNRIDVSTIGSEKVSLPDRVERPPSLVSPESIKKIIQNQPKSIIGLRNQTLLSLLYDTGILISEAVSLRKKDFKPNTRQVVIGGKRARILSVSPQTSKFLKKLTSVTKGRSFFFYGHTKSRMNPEKLTPRGAELLFAAFAKEHKLKHFHPRTLRHLFIVRKLLKNTSESEIQRELGWSTPYSFKNYYELIKEIKGRSESDQALYASK